MHCLLFTTGYASQIIKEVKRTYVGDTGHSSSTIADKYFINRITKKP